VTDDRTELQRLMSGEIGPEDIRRGAGKDWRFFGDYDQRLYSPDPKVDTFTDEWEAKVAIILGKHGRGMWIIDGPRGAGKNVCSVTCAFYFKQLYHRPIASNFPLKPAFGDYRTYTLDDIRDQLERLRALPKTAGTANWKQVNLAKYKIWLPSHVVIDDELHKEADKRRPGTDEMKLLSDLVMEIRHYDIVWMGMTPDREILDAKRMDNDMFVSTEVKCWKEIDPRTGKEYVWGMFYQNEGGDFQRISGPPDAIRFDVARFCNLYWTLGVGSSGAKLTKRPPMSRSKKLTKRGSPSRAEDASEEAEGIETRDWEPLD
jgi:hypothetical protein